MCIELPPGRPTFPPCLKRGRYAMAVAVALAIPCCQKKIPPEETEPEAVAEKAVTPSGPLRFGVLPAVDRNSMSAAYAPLLGAIGALTGRKVELVVAKDYDSLLQDLLSGAIHLGQMSAYAYVKGAAMRLRKGVSTYVLAQQRMASATEHRGVFVVRGEAKEKTLAELKGKRLAYVDRASSSGFYYPRIRLRALGLDPDLHFAETLFAASHDKAVKMLLDGQVDVVAVSAQSLVDVKGLRVIEETEPIPDDAIVSLDGLDAADRQRLKELFLKAHEDPRLAKFLQQRGIERYVPADVGVYLQQKKEMTRTPAAQMPPAEPVSPE